MEKTVATGVLICAVARCYFHLRQTVQVKENCAPAELKMWAGCCAVQVHCSPADGYCPSQEALPDAADWLVQGVRLVQALAW